MLASLAWLVALVAIGGAGTVAMVGLLRRMLRPARPDPDRPLDIVRPLAAAGLLVMPYVPWLPDLFPALLLLAGPGAWIWWGVLAGLVAVSAWPRRVEVAGGTSVVPDRANADLTPESPDRANADLTPWRVAQRRRRTTAIFLASVVASGVLADRFIRTPLFPGGDEPHYLVIAQSLWRDGDLRIENNHQRRDYDEYFHRDLTPHYLTRGVDREIYSIHPVGMPALMAPV
jgi:hypothetical protein